MINQNCHIIISYKTKQNERGINEIQQTIMSIHKQNQKGKLYMKNLKANTLFFLFNKEFLPSTLL